MDSHQINNKLYGQAYDHKNINNDYRQQQQPQRGYNNRQNYQQQQQNQNNIKSSLASHQQKSKKIKQPSSSSPSSWILKTKKQQNHQRILQIYSFLSKLLDTLSFQLAVTSPDTNSQSLLQILLWRKNNQISDSQAFQLYSGWLQARNVFTPDFFSNYKTRQIAVFPKTQLIQLQIVQQNFFNGVHITKSLQTLNNLYNQLYFQSLQDTQTSSDSNNNKLKTFEKQQKLDMQSIQQLFAYMDNQGIIHLRLSSLFFFCSAVLICQSLNIPLDYQAFCIHFDQYRNQMCQIQGKVTLRLFKNFLLNYKQRKIVLKNIMNIFGQIQKYSSLISTIGSNTKNKKKNELPNIIQQAFQKWKFYPRFCSLNTSSTQSRSRIQIYKRVFQENEYIFYDYNKSIKNESFDLIQFFTNKYGQQFIKCFQIDSNLLRQFSMIIKDLLNKYLEILRKIGNNYHYQNHYNNIQERGFIGINNLQYQIHKSKSPYNNGNNTFNKTPNKNNNHTQKIIANINQNGKKQLIKSYNNNNNQLNSSKQKQKQRQRQKTPVKSTNKKIKKDQNKNHRRQYTPTHYSSQFNNNNKESNMQREFGSAQKLISSSKNLQRYDRQRIMMISKNQYANTNTPPKVSNNNYYQMSNQKGTSFIDRNNNQPPHFQTLFYRNKRVQSYETVMKRLKKK